MFRVAFILLVVVLCANPVALLSVDDNNPIEKVFLLAAAGALIATRPVLATSVFLTVALAATTLLSALLTTFDAFSWERYARGLTSLLTPFLLLCAVPSVADRATVLRALSWAPAMSLAIGFAYFAAGIWSLWMFDVSGIYRLQGSLRTPAYLGGLAFVGSYAAIQYAAGQNRGYLLLAATNVIICLLTASRMAAFLTLSLCSFCLLLQFRVRIGLLVTVVLGAATTTAIILVHFDVAFLSRLASNSLSGRDLLWEVLQRYIDEHPWAGIGLGHQISVVPEDVAQATVTLAAHNEYLRLAVELGYPGAAMAFLLIGGIMLNVWTSPHIGRDPGFLAACAAFFAFCYSDNALSVPMIFLVVSAAAFALRTRVEVVEIYSSRTMPSEAH